LTPRLNIHTCRWRMVAIGQGQALSEGRRSSSKKTKFGVLFIC